MTSTTHTITILHTNDMHSSLEAMSRLSAFAKQLRRELEEQGHSVFFFDAGDAADRRVRFVGVTKGYAFPPMLAAMGYDLQALGNAISVTYGPQAAAKMAQRAEYPILAGNLFGENGPLLEGFQATRSLPLPGGLRLGVIGLTVHAPDIYALFNMDTPHFIDAARRWVVSLAQSGRGPLVVVSHLGVQEDRELAAAGLDIDAIIGGHTHTLLPEGEWVDGVLIAQTGQYAENLGRVDLVIDTETGAVLSKSAVVIPIPADTQPDPAALAAIQSAETEARELLDKPIVEIAERLGLDHFAECAIADLGADALLDRMHAEVALLTSGLFIRPLEAGTLTLGALDAACFTTANPQLSLVRGEQLLAALEHGLDPDFMQQRLKMFRGAPVGMPVIAGMVIEYAPSAETGQRVRRAWVQSQALEPQRLYRIAHTDAEVHRENSEYGYLNLEVGQVLKVEVPTILREAIEDYMRAHAPVHCPPSGRWIAL